MNAVYSPFACPFKWVFPSSILLILNFHLFLLQANTPSCDSTTFSKPDMWEIYLMLPPTIFQRESSIQYLIPP